MFLAKILYRFNASPRQSNPGPQLALVAGTCTRIVVIILRFHNSDYTAYFFHRAQAIKRID